MIQIGAVIGSNFSYGLLHAVHPISEPDLERVLRSLTDAELLYVRGIAPEATYQFKHALIRDAAYEALLKTRRKELHLTVARTIDEKFASLKESHPEVLARHWTEAGEIESAIKEWQRASERAATRRAYHEAEHHYREALALLQTLPESSERDGRELTLQVATGSVMGATRAWSADDTVEAYARARVLADRGGSTDSLQIFNGLWITALTRGESRTALVLADQLLKIAGGIGSPSALAIAHNAQGHTRHLLGDLASARQHLPKQSILTASRIFSAFFLTLESLRSAGPDLTNGTLATPIERSAMPTMRDRWQGAKTALSLWQLRLALRFTVSAATSNGH